MKIVVILLWRILASRWANNWFSSALKILCKFSVGCDRVWSSHVTHARHSASETHARKFNESNRRKKNAKRFYLIATTSRAQVNIQQGCRTELWSFFLSFFFSCLKIISCVIGRNRHVGGSSELRSLPRLFIWSSHHRVDQIGPSSSAVQGVISEDRVANPYIRCEGTQHVGNVKWRYIAQYGVQNNNLLIGA